MFKKLIEASIEAAPEMLETVAVETATETAKQSMSLGVKLGITAVGLALLTGAVYGVVRIFSNDEEALEDRVCERVVNATL